MPESFVCLLHLVVPVQCESKLYTKVRVRRIPIIEGYGFPRDVDVAKSSLRTVIVGDLM